MNNYSKVPLNYKDEGQYLRQLARVINQAVDGKTNNIGEFTISGSSPITVNDQRVNQNSAIILIPQSSNAYNADAWAVAGDKQFTVTFTGSHSGEPFKYLVVG